MSVEKRVKELKRDFVLQLYLGTGPFWENIRRARVVQGIQAEMKLPPPQLSPPSSASDSQKLQSWRSSVRGAWEPVVPQAYREATDWDSFVAACILYDPPEPWLEEFAQYGKSALIGPTPPGVKQKVDKSTHRMEPAIEWIDSEGHRAEAIEEFYQSLITELGRQFFEPRGYDVWQVVSDIYSGTDLLKTLRTRMTKIETHPYITVGKDTSDEDIQWAARVIRSMRDKNRGGRPARDKLIAIKCAALYHEHNHRDPNDGRRKRWTYERLAREIILEANPDKRAKHPKRVGEEYVRLGECLRRKRRG